MNKKSSESTLKVIQHEMYHTGKTRAAAEGQQYRVHGGVLYCSFVPLYKFCVHTVGLVWCWDAQAKCLSIPWSCWKTHYCQQCFLTSGVTAHVQQICVLFHGAPENKEVCQPIHEGKQEHQSKSVVRQSPDAACVVTVAGTSILPSTRNGVAIGCYGSLTHIECESSCGWKSIRIWPRFMWNQLVKPSHSIQDTELWTGKSWINNFWKPKAGCVPPSWS